MENLTRSSINNKRTNNPEANNPGHYGLLTIGIFVGFLGVILRFVSDLTIVDTVSNIIFIIGAIICFRCVFRILGD